MLRDVSSDTTLRFDREDPRELPGYDRCSFSVSLAGQPLSATVIVYDIQPQRWSQYFGELAANWQGWKGAKEHESLEGHLKLAATSDALGHIRVRALLRGIEVDSEWKAESSLYLEAGQLDVIAGQAKDFFG